MSNGYWSKLLNQRTSRRRAMTVTGGAAMGAAFLAACGGNGGGGGSVGGDTSGLITNIEDRTNSAQAGGTFLDSRNADTDNLDPFAASSLITSSISALAYNRLTVLKLGRMDDPDGDVVGDLAESWEWSPDRLTLTMKLRPGVKFHNIPPVNGREMDVEDVSYSWKRFSDTGLLRGELINAVNPMAPILSLNATDSRTIVFRLSEPMAYVPTLMATPNTGNPHMVPKEADGGFDLRRQQIGTGPYMLTNYEPSVRFQYTKHPNYYVQGRPFVDGLNLPIIPEYAQGVAQLKAGNLHLYNVSATDVLTVKNDEPTLNLYQGSMASIGQRSIFGWNPGPLDVNPFRDERVRQAYSMSWDRDLFIDVVYNVDKFRAEGLPVETRWNTELQCNFFPGWWLDPQGRDFGPNVQYFKHNIEEGKKLMAAAGFANGVEVTSSYFTTPQYGPNFPSYVEVLQGMAADVGFRFRPNIVDYATDFPRIYRDGKGRFDGMSYKLGPSGGGDDAIGRLIFFNHSRGGGYSGHDVDGRGDFSGDAWLDDTLNKAKGEVDAERRKSLAQEVQRYLAKKLYSIRWPGGATGFEVAWPAVQNYRVYRSLGTSWDARVHPNFWLDQTKAPFRRA
jgi:peptide/nickel transport system substrate-binding protein